MKHKTLRSISALLSLILLLSALIGCSGMGNQPTASSQPSEEVNTPKHPTDSKTVWMGYSLLFGNFSILISEWDDHNQVSRITEASSSSSPMESLSINNVYDESNLLLRSEFKTNGKHRFLTKYIYNEKKQLTHILPIASNPYDLISEASVYQEVFVYHNETDQLQKKLVYAMDELVCQDIYNSDGLVVEETLPGDVIRTYEYTSFGSVSKVFEYDSEDITHTQLLNTHTLDYDSNHRPVKYQKSNSEGVIQKEITYTYDERGNCLVFTETELTFRSHKIEFTYDMNNNLIHSIKYTLQNGEWKLSPQERDELEWKYDSNNRLIEKTEYWDVPPISFYRFYYNDIGQVTKIEGIRDNLNNTVSTIHTYEYLDNGLLQKETYYHVARLDLNEEIETTLYTYENGFPSKTVRIVEDMEGNTVEYREVHFKYTLVNGIYQIEFSVFDAEGNQIEY